jgi:tRNA A37 methylthiotransferase MiaB
MFLHVPVQCGSDKVLNDMKRGHTAQTFRDIVERFRTKFQNFTISTDVIVGFPTETKDDFEKTLKLLKETRPDIVNLSRSSQRPGTDAAEMEQIDVLEVKRRSKIAYELISKISEENNRKWIGWEGQVMFDEDYENQVRGRNFAYKSIFVNQQPKIGQISTVRITDSTTHSLIGKILS